MKYTEVSLALLVQKGKNCERGSLSAGPLSRLPHSEQVACVTQGHTEDSNAEDTGLRSGADRIYAYDV